MKRAVPVVLLLALAVGIAGGLAYAWVLDPVESYESAPDALRLADKYVYLALIGDLLGVSEKSEILAAALHLRLSALDTRVSAIPAEHRMTAARILDMQDNRFHVAGPLSFQYDIITRAGGRNVTGLIPEAYPKVNLIQLRQWDPQVIFSCGFDLNSIPQLMKKTEWRSLSAVQSGKVFVFDCALTCRTGPRIVDMVELLFNALYADRQTKKESLE